MERKKRSDTYIEPMPKAKFMELMREFKSIGGKYICNEESDSFLKNQNAEASTVDGYTILFRKKPSRSAVYEELFHAKQYREGKADGTYKGILECEIEAQEYLLNNSQLLELTDPEIMHTRKLLDCYKKLLKELKGGDNDDL